MKPSRFSLQMHRPKRLSFLGVILVTGAGVAGLWLVAGGGWTGGASRPVYLVRSGLDITASRKPHGGKKLDGSESATGEAAGTDSHPSPQNFAGTGRQPQKFQAKPVEPAAVLAVLASGEQKVDERVRQLQGMRGILLSKEERESALSFLSGAEMPEGLGAASIQWLADELLTVMRQQEPPWDGLAQDLTQVAFQPNTDPVVRDYIMQHLGHLWEQSGPKKEIESALWQAVESSGETTSGTALIALSRGYERDEQQGSLAKVRQRAIELTRSPETDLVVRVTALSIAGGGGGTEVEKTADDLIGDPETPLILRKVAEQVKR